MGMRMTICTWSDHDELQELIEGEGEADDPEAMAELGKAWEALHYVLTGGDRDSTQLPWGFLHATDFGPSGVFDPDQTRRIAAALQGLGVDDLEARCDEAALEAADLYGPTEPEVVAGAYEEARALVLEAAEEGLGLLVYVG